MVIGSRTLAWIPDAFEHMLMGKEDQKKSGKSNAMLRLLGGARDEREDFIAAGKKTAGAPVRLPRVTPHEDY